MRERALSSMRHGLRGRRVLLAASFGLLVVCCLLGVLSTFVYLCGVSINGCALYVAGGALQLVLNIGDAGGRAEVRLHWLCREDIRREPSDQWEKFGWAPRWRTGTGYYGTFATVNLPLWMPAAIAVAIVAIVHIWRTGRVHNCHNCGWRLDGYGRCRCPKCGTQSHRCRRCGYDLFGITGGCCPECGRPIA
jgi:hypothetical protein